MKELRLKTPKDIEDFLTGCAFYGTGGGGDVAIGRRSLNSCLEAGLDIVLKDPDEIKDDETYCCVFFMGSIAPKTPEPWQKWTGWGTPAVFMTRTAY